MCNITINSLLQVFMYFLGENSSLCLFCRRSVSIYIAIYKKIGSSKSMNSVNQVRQIRQKSCHYYFSHLTSLRILYKITPTILHQKDQLLTKYLWLESMLSTHLRYGQSILLWFHSSWTFSERNDRLGPLCFLEYIFMF